MLKYITLQSTRNVTLLEQLNAVQYKDYKVIAILQRGEDHIAYLELIPKSISAPTPIKTTKEKK